ncbi:acyl-CoA synthetase [Nocardia nova]|uniref:acyl-CoA synthetase n=1 Tax=Nocardia nova TaxID=37330 RepID=UPI0011DD222F
MGGETLLAGLHDPSAPDDPVITVGQGVVSRDELLGRATAVADQVSGVGCVAVDATASIETIVAIVGCLLANTAVVPVPPDSGTMERRHILADSGARMWLGQARDDIGIPVVAIDRSNRSSTGYREPDAADTALILYTSGTTGAPKGVQLSRGAIARGVDGLAAVWEWSADDTLVHGLPLFHVHGLVLGVLGALRIGSRLVHTVRPTPEAYAAAEGSLYFGVPTVWSRVCSQPAAARALRSARLLVSGSAPLPVPVFDRLTDLTGMRPVERYGMTETVITLSTRYRGERRPGWVGEPLPNVRTRLRDERGELVPHDGETIGRLEVSTPTLFDGYVGRPDATAETFTDDGWFRTGDIAVADRDGFHRIVGRESVDLIKSGGYRIGAGEVEQALLAHPDIREAAVVGVPDSDLGQRIVAFVVGDVGDCAALTDFVASRLSVHKRPREVRRVDALPRNAMGKVQKTRLVADIAAR